MFSEVALAGFHCLLVSMLAEKAEQLQLIDWLVDGYVAEVSLSA